MVEPGRDHPVVAELADRGLPYVTLGRPVDGAERVPYVDPHGGVVLEQLLEHVREQGARRPALIIGASERHTYIDERAVYERAAGEQGWPAIVGTAAEEQGEQAGYRACAALLRDHPEVDAICAMVDTFAVGAVRAVTESGRAVPDDVLVVTRYDGIRARTSQPPLTAVNLHLGEAADRAVELLLARLRGEGTDGVVPAPAPDVVAHASSLRVTRRA